jgi:hypothetical protein
MGLIASNFLRILRYRMFINEHCVFFVGEEHQQRQINLALTPSEGVLRTAPLHIERGEKQLKRS